MIKLISPKDGASVSVMTDVQKEFVRLHRAGDCEEIDRRLRELTEGHAHDFSRPAEAIFSWYCDDPTVVMTLEISGSEDFDGPAPVHIGTIRQSAEDGSYFVPVTNFYTGAKYFWRVICGEEISSVRTFSTPEGGLRPVFVDNVPNFRDLGGRMTASGRRIRQGLLYRGTHLEEDEGNGLTEPGREIFVRELGIKTELDLREESFGKVESSPAGEGVRLAIVPFDSSWGGTLNDRGMGQLKMIFDVISDKNNYPVYVHCYTGADRTGFFGVVLGAILGVPDSEIILDYEFTSLHEERDWERCEGAEGYFGFLDETYPGHTPGELVLIHLREYGIDPDLIEKVREIMLED